MKQPNKKDQKNKKYQKPKIKEHGKISAVTGVTKPAYMSPDGGGGSNQ